MGYSAGALAEFTTTKTVAPPVPRGMSLPPSTPLVPQGRVLGRYELVAPLGSGGMADVWLARIRARGRFVRLVALKILRADALTDPRARERFMREAEISASIHHANVVDVTDVGEEGGLLYQAMTLVEGDSLAGLMHRSEKPLPWEATLSIVIDALRGLHAAHESVDAAGKARSVVHRDVSPQNILVGRDGLARISDFGIARVLSDDDESTRSREGKYAYFAPEQAQRGPIDQRTDVFAMGIVLWEAVTRERLFKSADTIETLEAVCHRPVPDLSLIHI